MTSQVPFYGPLLDPPAAVSLVASELHSTMMTEAQTYAKLRKVVRKNVTKTNMVVILHVEAEDGDYWEMSVDVQEVVKRCAPTDGSEDMLAPPLLLVEKAGKEQVGAVYGQHSEEHEPVGDADMLVGAGSVDKDNAVADGFVSHILLATSI